MFVTFVLDEKYTWSAAADGRAVRDAHAVRTRIRPFETIESSRLHMMSGPRNGERARNGHGLGRRQLEQVVNALDGAARRAAGAVEGRERQFAALVAQPRRLGKRLGDSPDGVVDIVDDGRGALEGAHLVGADARLFDERGRVDDDDRPIEQRVLESNRA